MLIRSTDFNGAGEQIARRFAAEYENLTRIVESMPLNLKASDQAGIQGSLIFDPVATNAHIKNQLAEAGWRSNVQMPPEFHFLGTDVDFAHNGLLLEVQFSNYPFLLNNTIRSELLFKARIPVGGHPIDCVIIVTKGHMFPASNSTLYFEQALNQLTALADHGVFDVPIRLVGLFEEIGSTVSIKVNEYRNPRYSRDLVNTELRRCRIEPGPSVMSRANLRILEE